MAEHQDTFEDLVPFEIGLQSGETVLMWALGSFFWLLTFVFMGMSVEWQLNIFGIITFVLGGILMLSSQFVTRYNPLKTTRVPVTGIILWFEVVFLSFFVLLEGWKTYLDTSPVFFIIGYLVMTLLLTALLFASNFLTISPIKVLNWMSLDMVGLLYTGGLISMLIGITYIGFNNTTLLWIDKLNVADWAWLFLFSISFLFMLELNDGAHRFNEIIRYAKKRATGEFSLTPVINNYYIMGFILMLIIGVSILVVLILNFFLRWVSDFLSEQLAASVMVNSIYSVVFTIALVFIPLWIVLIIWTEYRARKEVLEEEEIRKQSQKSTRPGIA